MSISEHINIYYSSAELGGFQLYFYASRKGIIGISIKDEKCFYDDFRLTRVRQEDPYLFGIFEQMKEYFSGVRKTFSLPLDIDGTPFQLDVWNELKKIPYGHTISYKELALRVGHEKAFRAVGNANGSNPVPIIIPCHRVIKSNGAIGGYTGGVDIKNYLLTLEDALEPVLL